MSGSGGTQSAISMITVKPTVGNSPGPIPYLHVRDIKSTSVKLVWGSPSTKSLSPVTGYVISIHNMQEGSKAETVQVRVSVAMVNVQQLDSCLCLRK